LIFELSLASKEEITYAGLYGLRASFVEEWVELWYAIHHINLLADYYWRPEVTLYFKQQAIGVFLRDPDNFNFYWKRTCKLQKL
jgi:hypothetical protein